MSKRFWQEVFGSEPTYNPECDSDFTQENPVETDVVITDDLVASAELFIAKQGRISQVSFTRFELIWLMTRFGQNFATVAVRAERERVLEVVTFDNIRKKISAQEVSDFALGRVLVAVRKHLRGERE